MIMQTMQERGVEIRCTGEGTGLRRACCKEQNWIDHYRSHHCLPLYPRVGVIVQETRRRVPCPKPQLLKFSQVVYSAGRVKLMKKSCIRADAEICVGQSPAANCEKLGDVEAQSCSAILR